MRMGFAGRGNENDKYRMVAEHGNGLCAGRENEMIDIKWWQNMGMDCARGGGNRKVKTRNGQNVEWPTTIAVLINVLNRGLRGLAAGFQNS
jgi:hypothetical protein